jgi:hypothetical protein
LFGRCAKRGDAAGESGPCGEVEGVEPVSETAAVLCARARPPQPEERASRVLGGAGAPQPAERETAYEASWGRDTARLPSESRAPGSLLPHVRADTVVAIALTSWERGRKKERERTKWAVGEKVQRRKRSGAAAI